MAARRAATTRLEPGQHSIDRATVRERAKDKVLVLDWSVRLHDGTLIEKRTQAPAGAGKAEVRRRAKVTAAELLKRGVGGTWKGTSPITDYIEKVSRPAIEAAKLRPNSRVRYRLVLRLLVGECSEHRHADSLKGHSIASGTRFRALESCLQEIAKLHGFETARQARTVLSKYVVQQLNRDELVSGNPLAGMTIDLSSDKTPAVKRGGQALTRDQRDQVLDYLLALNPSDVPKIKQGRWKTADRVAKRGNVIDITLLQSATGLRASEANAITWENVETADDGTVHVQVTEEVSKTHRARRVPILDERVAERMLARRNAAPSEAAHVIGAPVDPMRRWDKDNCAHAVADLYRELADALDIELLRTARSHVWRATLNTMLMDDVPEVIRAAYFGHTTAINRAAYTDLTDTSGMLTAARRLRAV